MGMRLFRTLAMTAATLALLAQPVLAADAAGSKARQIQPLKPGKSAGVHHAQLVRGGVALVGTGGVIALVALAATSGGGGGGNTNQPNMQTVPVTTAP
jgi:hypothetical protein